MRKESPTGFASKQASMRREAPVAAQEGGQESVPEEQAEEAAASESQAPQAEQKGGMEQEVSVCVYRCVSVCVHVCVCGSCTSKRAERRDASGRCL